MLKNLRKRTEGFTIIEVLIVLAIAGMIMLIVFLAVPALNRNSANTRRKSDVSALLGGFSEWSNNKNGKVPSNAAEFFEASQNAKLSIYTAPVSSSDLRDFNFTAANNTAVTPTLNTVFVKTGAKCNAAGDNFGGTSPSSRSIAVVYTVETANGAGQAICQES